MDGENHGKPYYLMDDLGGFSPYFWVDTHIEKIWKTSTKQCGVGCFFRVCLSNLSRNVDVCTWLEMDCWEAFDRARMLVMSGLTT